MSVFKSQFSSALSVIPSDNAVIPNPIEVASGTNTSVSAGELVDSAALFVTNNVSVGDVVYNRTDGTAATVVTVTDETTIVLNANIFAAAAKIYKVYQNSAQSGLPNQGCYLYIGGAGSVNVVTLSQETVTISGLTAGSILPLQVSALNSAASGTTATLIIALW